MLPALHRPGLSLTAWSAACSHGAEAYSLAILCQEDASLRQSRMPIGTDIDQAVLQQAKAGMGPYTADEVKNAAGTSFHAGSRRRGGSYYVLPALRNASSLCRWTSCKASTTTTST